MVVVATKRCFMAKQNWLFVTIEVPIKVSLLPGSEDLDKYLESDENGKLLDAQICAEVKAVNYLLLDHTYASSFVDRRAGRQKT